MQETNMRVDAPDDFAVKFQHKTQDPVRCGMLRPKIDHEIAGRGFGHVGLLSLPWLPGKRLITSPAPSVRTGTEDISATRNEVDGTIAAFLGRNLLVDQRSGRKSISVFDHGTSRSGEFIRSHIFRCT
jgi:hypothetical protein